MKKEKRKRKRRKRPKNDEKRKKIRRKEEKMKENKDITETSLFIVLRGRNTSSFITFPKSLI